MPCQISVLIGVLAASLAHLSSGEKREDVLETRKLEDGARIAFVRIHPPPRDPQTDARGIWQFVLRYEPPKGDHQVLLRDFGPEDDMPAGDLPTDPLQVVEVGGKGRLLAVAYNAHGYCWLHAWAAKRDGSWQNIAFSIVNNKGQGALAGSADGVTFVFAQDGSITATLETEGQRKRFVLKPEKRRTDPGYPYPWPTPEKYFVSPWEEIAEKRS